MNESPDHYDSDNSPYSIRPLPLVLRNGLAVVATMGFLSFFTSLGLLVFLTFKLVSWHNGPPKQRKEEDQVTKVEAPTTADAKLVIPNNWLAATEAAAERAAKENWWRRAINEPPNQFLVLIFNLLLADIQQALAFLLNAKWLTKNSIEVGTKTCWTQGWFVSTGDLASSVFITGIAIHTYVSIVSNKKIPTWIFHTAITIMWTFVYGTGILTVIITGHGKAEAGLYVRAGAWCWVNSKYQDIRLTLHYLWIFAALIVTTMIYFAIFLHLQRIARKSGGVISCGDVAGRESSLSSSDGASPSSFSVTNSTWKTGSVRDGQRSRIWRPVGLTTVLRRLPDIPDYARQHTFLLYPFVYVICTMPLAAGRLASMAGHEVSLAYFCFAGAMIACNGWMDVVLYSSTRRSIVFSADGPPTQEVGLETFAFMCNAPPRFGNITTVISGADPNGNKNCSKWNDKLSRKGPKSGSLKGLTVDCNESTESMRGFGMGEGSIMGMAIQCERTTTVSVEEVNTPTPPTRARFASWDRKMSDASFLSIDSFQSSGSGSIKE
ncbi:G protein-coupled glucose receptor regulating Gpa2-domain-containing protein [Colletotrichum navitas]|uniref:G protein-coupled glucose receptor regulating Gpa2-domain-containing protein n=1 Tax=Colletotrichum navitas TaxID=681940 RepID=A0AAD8PRI1_9PEZI|nr:G protein-coupled glucose receptor regulating Gpa2-domain-containing protein [Colletotrichum navitas]KAK1579340.1 G protein-coupled glucose receptor regulating Gpa2-domain-containing protein [Colletotrichum navitas]